MIFHLNCKFKTYIYQLFHLSNFTFLLSKLALKKKNLEFSTVGLTGPAFTLLPETIRKLDKYNGKQT